MYAFTTDVTRKWSRATVALGLVLATLALVACNDDPGRTPSTSSISGQDLDGAPRVTETLEIDVELGDLYIEPATIQLEAGQSLLANVSNVGVLPHDFRLDEAGTRMLNGGESETVEFGPFEQSVQIICTVPGHAAAGMIMNVEVVGAPVAANGDGHHGGASGEPFAQVRPNATPGPEWEPFDPVLPPAVGTGGTLHQIQLDATEVVLEVAPGVTQEMWTFNDQVPGPVLRGKVGDVFEITLTNRGRLGHSIDFHASKVAWDQEMRTLAPGESLVYRFEAKHAGVYMYHCGTAPALHHIGNGMWGAIIIDPPVLAEVDREFIFIQSEFYLGPEGEPGDLGKMQRDEWDIVVFNAYHNQYAHAPIRIEAHERIRAHVLNVGPSENSSFHIVGTIFDTVYKEGAYLLRPDEMRGGSQALDLQPAQGGFVEFEMDAEGLYLMVTHKFSNVGKGAMGIFQAGDVEVGDVAH
ncbi:MAG: multicopper oxidase domain-containing protein [Dehalococcoidia bacterium]|nr:multicopper oxidase domain-containing protein [Dehalococcoidia bacterium]